MTKEESRVMLKFLLDKFDKVKTCNDVGVDHDPSMSLAYGAVLTLEITHQLPKEDINELYYVFNRVHWGDVIYDNYLAEREKLIAVFHKFDKRFDQ